MKKDDKNIENILKNVKAPNPSQQAEASAKLAANAAFEAAQEKKSQETENNIKGNESSDRFMGNQNKKRSFIMNNKHIFGGAVAASALVVLTLNLDLHKQDFEGPLINSDEALTRPPVGAVPSPAIAQAPVAPQVAPAPRSFLPPPAFELPAPTPPSAISQAPMVVGNAKQKSSPKKARVQQQAESEASDYEVADFYAPSVKPSTPAVAAAPMMAREKKVMGGVSRSMIAPTPPQDEIVSHSYNEEGRDKFEDIKTNSIKVVGEDPVSTFSVDVDTTSYSFARRQLNNNVLPQKDAIRVEELINYFDYQYKVPQNSGEPFAANVAVYDSPWNANKKLMHIGIKGYELTGDKPRSNLVFLLDVSGSMNSPDKLPLLVNSFKMMVDNLDAQDTISIVTYAGSNRIALEPTKVSDKSKIFAALDGLYARGSTAGADGIKTAYQLAEQNFDTKAINRIMLATDGDFNVGITNPDELQDFVERKREKGIFLSVLGFGQGNYNDHIMQKLAQNGNGNAAYIDNLNEARKVLVNEASATLFPIAKDVKIQVEFNPDTVAEYRLVGYETRMLKREDFNNDKIDAGDIGAGHTVTAIYEITEQGSPAVMVDDLRYGRKAEKATNLSGEYANLKIRYKLPDESTSKLITAPISKRTSEASTEMKFAAAVAGFAQLLRGGEFTGELTYDDVIELAQNNKGNDKFGYRSEFINLVRIAKNARGM